jgi:hypothetical protein
MRRIVCGVLFAVFGTCQVARAAAISVAGTDCGTDQLLGLSFIVPVTGTNLPLGTNACPAGNLGVGAIVGDNGFGTPLYGTSITSIEFNVTDPGQLQGLQIIDGSLLGIGEGGITFTPTGFILSGSPGIQITCGIIGADIDQIFPCTPKDALITFRGFEPGTEVTVSAVNGIPEPASLTLLLLGAGGAALHRRRVHSKTRI